MKDKTKKKIAASLKKYHSCARKHGCGKKNKKIETKAKPKAKKESTTKYQNYLNNKETKNKKKPKVTEWKKHTGKILPIGVKAFYTRTDGEGLVEYDTDSSISISSDSDDEEDIPVVSSRRKINPFEQYASLYSAGIKNAYYLSNERNKYDD
tara:strand:- start:41 stop:496 length:456 start_codon:yes stop_codon:yes gene_type:complete